MNDEHTAATRRAPVRKSLMIGVVAAASISLVGVAVGAGVGVETSGSGDDAAVLSCPGGMSRLGHEFNENMSIFPFDPAIHVSELYTVADDFFKVEDIDTGAHAGTHIDVPGHFIEDGRTIEELAAEEFVWPVYKIDVRHMTFTDNFVEQSDIEAYEAEHGPIPPGSLVVLQTGAEEFFGLDGPGDEYRLARKGNGNGHGNGNLIQPHLADNIDDMFDFVNPGFSFDAVQWMFDARFIDGVGSDAYGPDAATDANFDATYATLFNDGVAVVALANLDSVSVSNDVMIATGVALTDGSGATTDPIACHGASEDDS